MELEYDAVFCDLAINSKGDAYILPRSLRYHFNVYPRITCKGDIGVSLVMNSDTAHTCFMGELAIGAPHVVRVRDRSNRATKDEVIRLIALLYVALLPLLYAPFG